MTWTASLLPDDALPPDSLVGRLLRPEPHYVSDKAFDALQSFIAEDTASPPPATVEPQPLWREMLKAGMHAERCDPGTVRHSVAAEIEALRDWLFTLPCHSRYAEEYRQILTEQARIARGD